MDFQQYAKSREALTKFGLNAKEVSRFQACFEKWMELQLKGKPPPPDVLRCRDPASDKTGIYANVNEVRQCLPNPERLQQYKASDRRNTMQAMPLPNRSATLSNMSIAQWGGPASSGPQTEALIKRSLRAVTRFMTPEAERAPWLLRSLDHKDAVEALAQADVGCFVVRFSAKAVGHFVLAYKMRLGDKFTVKNAYIRGTPKGVCLQNKLNDESQQFPTLMDFLNFYTSPKGANTLMDGSLKFLPPKIAPPRSAYSAQAASVPRDTKVRSMILEDSGGGGTLSESTLDQPQEQTFSVNSEEDQRDRKEEPPVGFDQIHQQREDTDVCICRADDTPADIVEKLAGALQAQGLKVWSKDTSVPHLKTPSGWRQRAYKMEAVFTQTTQLFVVILSKNSLSSLREPYSHDHCLPFIELALQSAPNVVPVFVDGIDIDLSGYTRTIPDHDWCSWSIQKTMTGLLQRQSINLGDDPSMADAVRFIKDSLQKKVLKGTKDLADVAQATSSSSRPVPTPRSSVDSMQSGGGEERQPAEPELPTPPEVPQRRRPASVPRPSSVVREGDFRWFTKHLGDRECKELVNAGGPGAFMVRVSSAEGSFVLCVKDKGIATNYLMRFDPATRRYHFAERDFASITDIIFTFRATPFLAQSGETIVLGEPPSVCVDFQGPTEAAEPADTSTDAYWADNWEIEPEQLVLQSRLGEGEFGEVWRGLLKGTGEHQGLVAKVAVKKLKQEQLAREFMDEAKIMTELDHNNLVRIYGVSTTSRPRLIIAELCQNGSLKDYLNMRFDHNDLCSEMLLRRFAFDICLGMQYLEDKNYLHCDLAARNVLVTADDRCKVADFGFAKMTGTSRECRIDPANAKVPIRWTAPEVINEGRFSSKSDVYSYGITIFEVATHGAVPYPGLSNKVVLNKVLNENYRNVQMEGVSDELYSIMCMCWKANKDERPTFRQLAVRMKQLVNAHSVELSSGFGDEGDEDSDAGDC